MALAAAQAIDAIAARLVGATPADARVYTSRAWPLGENQLPAWRVIAQDEVVEPLARNWPPTLQHTLVVDLQGAVRAVADLDDHMHAMAAAAIAAVYSARFSGLAVQLTGITREPATEGEAAVGRVTVTLAVQFQTRANAPETIL